MQPGTAYAPGYSASVELDLGLRVAPIVEPSLMVSSVLAAPCDGTPIGAAAVTAAPLVSSTVTGP